MKKILIEQVVEGIKAGGYTQGRNHLIEWSSDHEYEGEVVNADAIGTAALNLGLDAYSLLNALIDVSPRKNSSVSLASFIVELNDTKELGLTAIAEQVLVKFKLKLKTEIDVQEGDFTKVTNYKGTIY